MRTADGKRGVANLAKISSSAVSIISLGLQLALQKPLGDLVEEDVDARNQLKQFLLPSQEFEGLVRGPQWKRRDVERGIIDR